MKKISYLFTICLLVLVCSCNDSNDMLENDSSSDDISLRDSDESEMPSEIEETDDSQAASKAKYCYWKISSVGDCDKPRFEVGDLICYRCTGNTCLSDQGRTELNKKKRNFGGCIYEGETVNDCADDHDCAGKFLPKSKSADATIFNQ